MTPAVIGLAPELIEQVEKLTPEQRDKLRDFMDELDSPPAKSEEVVAAERAALKAELTRRWERLRSGQDVAIPADEVIAELRRKAEARRAP